MVLLDGVGCSRVTFFGGSRGSQRFTGGFGLWRGIIEESVQKWGTVAFGVLGAFTILVNVVVPARSPFLGVAAGTDASNEAVHSIRGGVGIQADV